MALYHYTANDEQALVTCLAEKLNEQNSVFTPQWIVCGHTATNNYVTEQLANKNGIAANIKFTQVIPLIEIIHYKLGLREERSKLIHNEQLVWYIEDELKQTGFQALNEANKVIEYIGNDSLKRFTLAEKIASLVSSYQEETPELISAWNKGEFHTQKEDEKWQAYIWKALKDRNASQLRDLTQFFQEIKDALQKEAYQNTLKTHFPAIFFYGNLPYSKQVIDLLESLSEFIDVYVFRRAFSTAETNPLVANLGTVLKRDRDLWEGSSITHLESKSTTTDGKHTLFSALKQDLLHNTFPQLAYKKSDDSLVIASSYSVSREVEALYHHLLHLFSTNEALNAKDITVVVPDMETYAPVIKTYFDYANKIDFKGDPETLIPYTMYDTSHRVYASPYAAIEALLHIEKERFTSKSVMKLLDFDFIREQFGFKDTAVLIRALDKANIRHGFTGDTELETHLVSWQYGLKRLIFGFCLPPDTGKVDFDGQAFYPVDEFEESDRLELMKLLTFIDRLNKWLEKREESKTLSEWIHFLEQETLDVFISEQTYDTSRLRRLFGQLTQLVENNLNETYSFEVIRYYLVAALGNMDAGERIGYGGVRFVSPSIFLSVPAKVYAFLGLNSADFPRKVTKASFDLSQEDRLTKTDYDKNLFLSVLLAAEEKVYFSYIGNATKDNSIIPPSSLLAELEAHLKDKLGMKNEKDTLILRHPLHSFNSRYNSENEPLLVNYDLSTNTAQEVIGSSKVLQPIHLPEKDGKKVIPLRDLIGFIEDPVKHYFTKTLGIYMADRDIELAESELFELDGLQGWKVKDAFIQAALENGDVNEQEFKMKGDLPLSNIGSQKFEKLKEEVQPIFQDERLSNLLQNEREATTVQIHLNDYILEGKVDGIYGDTLLFLTSSSDKAKYKIRALVNFYAAFLGGNVDNLYYLFEGGESKTFSKEKTDLDDIKEQLEKWCKSFENGLHELIYFDSAFVDKKGINKDLDPTQLNYLVLYDTILKDKFRGVYPSDYFSHIALDDAFLNIKIANSFLTMYEAVKNFITPLN
jgi:exodeoxyribonuclease V gamma subunit